MQSEEQTENKNLKKEIIDIMLDELVRRKLIKKNNSTFDDTKHLLKNYAKLKHSKKGINKQIKGLENSKNSLSGLKPKFTKNNLEINSNNVNLNDLDTINKRILDLKQDIEKIDNYLTFIEDALENIKENPDYTLLERIYFKNEDPKDLAIEKNCDETTIYRKTNKLLNELKVYIFPGKYIDEIN